MPDNTNMNVGQSPFEFKLPLGELDGQFQPAETGNLTIPVEVVEVGKEFVTFRKRGRARTESAFRQATVADLEQTLPVTDER